MFLRILNSVNRVSFSLFCFSFIYLLYNFSLLLIDLIIPFVIQGLFCFLYSFLLIFFMGACLSRIVSIFDSNFTISFVSFTSSLVGLENDQSIFFISFVNFSTSRFLYFLTKISLINYSLELHCDLA